MNFFRLSDNLKKKCKTRNVKLLLLLFCFTNFLFFVKQFFYIFALIPGSTHFRTSLKNLFFQRRIYCKNFKTIGDVVFYLFKLLVNLTKIIFKQIWKLGSNIFFLIQFNKILGGKHFCYIFEKKCKTVNYCYV